MKLWQQVRSGSLLELEKQACLISLLRTRDLLQVLCPLLCSRGCAEDAVHEMALGGLQQGRWQGRS